MKYTVNYYSMPNGGHLFSTPEYTHSEYIECNTEEDLNSYIESKKDLWGHRFSVNKDFGKGISSEFNYISSQGGVKVSVYKRQSNPKFKNIYLSKGRELRAKLIGVHSKQKQKGK